MPRPRVHSIAVEVTAHCQQRCDHCYNGWRDDDGAGLAPGTAGELFARVRKLLDALDVGHVTVTGGEPFARRDVFDLLDLLVARGVRVQIVSNGGLIDDRLAGRLAPYGVDYVQVALHGADAALHEDHAGAGHFEPTLEGIRALKRHRVPVVGCVVVTRKNAARVAEILALFGGLGVRDVALSRFSPAGHAARHVAALLPSRDDLLVAFRQAVPFATRPGCRVTSTMPIPPCAVEVEELAPIRFGSCAIGSAMQEFALGPDGRLRNCALHASDLGGGRDVLDDDVDPVALVTGREVATYRRELPEFCRGCLHAASCGGGCGASAEWVLGSRRLPDPLVWQHVDDGFGAKLAAQRADGRRLEVLR